MDEFFKISKKENSWLFENFSEFNLVFFFIPEKPKRKMNSFLVLPPDTFSNIDSRVYNLDLSKIGFRFEIVNK